MSNADQTKFYTRLCHAYCIYGLDSPKPILRSLNSLLKNYGIIVKSKKNLSMIDKTQKI